MVYFNSRLHGRRLCADQFEQLGTYNFNSRLHGRRPAATFSCGGIGIFQLTPSRKATANSNNNCFYIILTFIDSFQNSPSNVLFSLSLLLFFSSSHHFSGANLPVFFCLLTFRTLPRKLYRGLLNRFILVCYIVPSR